MKYKILAVIVALGGFAGAAATQMTPAQAATGTPPSHLCSPGTNVFSYCVSFCPSGTLVGAYCQAIPASPSNRPPATPGKPATPGTPPVVGPSGVVLPQGPPTVFGVKMWGARRHRHRGPALKFHLRLGINGAPDLKFIRLTLPDGLSFVNHRNGRISVGGHRLKAARRTMTMTLRKGLPTLYVYIKNHAMVESNKLRRALIKHKNQRVTFHLRVSDAAGKATNLTFRIKPRS